MTLICIWGIILTVFATSSTPFQQPYSALAVFSHRYAGSSVCYLLRYPAIICVNTLSVFRILKYQ